MFKSRKKNRTDVYTFKFINKPKKRAYLKKTSKNFKIFL